MLVLTYKHFHHANEGFNIHRVYDSNMRWNKTSRAYNRDEALAPREAEPVRVRGSSLPETWAKGGLA